jgi:hypothetical protein
LQAGASLADGRWLLHDGLALGIIAAALFVPIIPLKWVMAYLAAISGIMLALSFVFGAFMGALLGPGGMFGFLGVFMSTVFTFVEMAFQFWLASTLFRDIYRLQAMRR